MVLDVVGSSPTSRPSLSHLELNTSANIPKLIPFHADLSARIASHTVDSTKSAKLGMTEAQALEAAEDLLLTIIPFTPMHAYRLFRNIKDPFDRMLIAAALVEDISIVGSDRCVASTRD